VAATYDNHRRFRRALLPAFSDRAIRAQGPLFKRHVDTLITSLRKVSEDGNTPVDMVRMYNFTTFDVMGDFVFGEPLGLLEHLQYTPQVEAPFKTVKYLPLMQMIEYYPLLKATWDYFEPKAITAMRHSNVEFARAAVDARLSKGSDQPDMWNLVMSAGGDKGMSPGEMYSNSDVFIIAGSETTATLLSGLTFMLLTHPDKMARIVKEIRSTFTSDPDIDMHKLAGLPYLNACISEALRVYPPLPAAVPRFVGANVGASTEILGRQVPSGTRLSVHHWASSHSPDNFTNPDTFVPERWLGTDERYKNDKLQGAQPFSFGPRNCIGQNMALHEMRMIAAKVLFNFDLELCSKNDNWLDQRVFVLWEKRNLMCKLTPVAVAF